MGKVKALGMELEERYYEKINREIGGCVCVEELQKQMLEHRNMVPHLTDEEVDEILVDEEFAVGFTKPTKDGTNPVYHSPLSGSGS